MNAQRYGRLGLSLASALLGATLASAAFGQNAGEEAAGPPLYRVEIIVFARNGSNPAEEDFDHIARRESASGGRRADQIDDFDFAPYVPPQENLLDDPSVAESARSRLLLGRDQEPAAEREAAGSDPQAGAGTEAAEQAADGTDPAAPGSTDGALGATDAPLADGGAGTIVDPFGPGNAVAPFRFRLLAEDELELVNVRQQLRRNYTPLVHGGWIQEGLPPQQARPFDLAYLGASTPSGTIRLHVSRFLHLTLDLDFRPGAVRRPQPSVADGAAETPGGAFDDRASPPFGAGPALLEVEVSRRYHLNAERRMRSGEVHYFDHPFFGVIAIVRPYEPPAPPQTEGVRPAA